MHFSSRRLVLAAASAAAVEAVTLPTIQTSQGSLRGAISEYRDSATVYKGIPYAAPPVGSLRWKAPQAAANWTGVFNATAFGPQCAQPTTDSSAGIFSTGSTVASEDCLTLNVWTPTYANTSDLTAEQRPVYAWIFGGRFEGGSADVKTYDGSGLAAQGVVVVTLNYRLGAFGFLAHAELDAEEGAHNSSGNYGLLDQQAALQWIQDNIAAFGGNPGQVVVGGQSAGSASALDIMYSPLTTGLVHGVIAESGARGPHDPMTGGLATSYRNKTWALAKGADFVANTLNVSSIAAARNVSATDLATLGGSLSDTTFDTTVFASLGSAFMDPPLWRPVADGYVLPLSYGSALQSGSHLDVPMLTGNNHDESGASPDPGMTASSYASGFATVMQNFSTEFFALYPAANDSQADNSSNAFFRDLSRVSTWTWVADWAAGGASSSVYTYFWTHSPAENYDSGSYHGSELWYTFANIPYADYSNVTWTADDYAIESTMSAYWVNFISCGNPNGCSNSTSSTSSNLTYWPPTTTDAYETMWLGDEWGTDNLTETAEKREFILSWLDVLHEW